MAGIFHGFENHSLNFIRPSLEFIGAAAGLNDTRGVGPAQTFENTQGLGIEIDIEGADCGRLAFKSRTLRGSEQGNH